MRARGEMQMSLHLQTSETCEFAFISFSLSAEKMYVQCTQCTQCTQCLYTYSACTRTVPVQVHVHVHVCTYLFEEVALVREDHQGAALLESVLCDSQIHVRLSGKGVKREKGGA